MPCTACTLAVCKQTLEVKIHFLGLWLISKIKNEGVMNNNKKREGEK